jgi:hypothetical protein
LVPALCHRQPQRNRASGHCARLGGRRCGVSAETCAVQMVLAIALAVSAHVRNSFTAELLAPSACITMRTHFWRSHIITCIRGHQLDPSLRMQPGSLFRTVVEKLEDTYDPLPTNDTCIMIIVVPQCPKYPEWLTAKDSLYEKATKKARKTEWCALQSCSKLVSL